LSDDSDLKKELKKFAIKSKDGILRNVVFNVKSQGELRHTLTTGAASKLYSLYDPSNIMNSINKGMIEEGK